MRLDGDIASGVNAQVRVNDMERHNGCRHRSLGAEDGGAHELSG
jgi:hypothetical protein